MARFVVLVLVLSLIVAPAVSAQPRQEESLLSGLMGAFLGLWDRVFSQHSAPEKSGAFVDPSGVVAAPRKTGAFIDPSGVAAAPHKTGAFTDPEDTRVVRFSQEVAEQRE